MQTATKYKPSYLSLITEVNRVVSFIAAAVIIIRVPWVT